MTSKQIVLLLTVMVGAAPLWFAAGCTVPTPVVRPESPYAGRRVFAVAPFRNESGSAHADGVRVADRFAAELARVRGLDTLPVNRTLDTMAGLGLTDVSSVDDARRLLAALGADGLVVGSVTAYDPYDPPVLGLAVELYLGGADDRRPDGPDPRALQRAGRLPDAEADRRRRADPGPASAIAGHYAASDPDTDALLTAYAVERGPDGTGEMTRRRYRGSIDLFTEFVGFQLTERLMDAERRRRRDPFSP